MSSCESRIWPLIWGLIYTGKDWVQMTTAQNLEITRVKQQIVRWNELSSVRAISPLVFQVHQSETFVQKEDVLFLIIGTIQSKCLSLRSNIFSTTHKFNGPLLSWSVCLTWEAEPWKGSQKDSTLMERINLLHFLNEWPIFLLSCCLSVNS